MSLYVSATENFTEKQKMTAQMFCDFMLYNEDFVKRTPSFLGAAAIYATKSITKESPVLWTLDQMKITEGIREEELIPFVDNLFRFIKQLQLSKRQTLFEKYQRSDHLEVAYELQFWT